MIRHHPARFSRSEAAPVLERVCLALSRSCEVFPCGSWRRELPDVGDLDVVAVGSFDPIELFHESGALELREGSRVHLLHEVGGRRLWTEVYAATEETLGAALLRWTGSAEHNARLRARAALLGLRLDGEGLKRGGLTVASRTEREVLEALGEPWLEPRDRIR